MKIKLQPFKKDFVQMAKQTQQDLLDIIASLTARLEVLETAKTTKKAGRPEVVKAPKPYAKLNGHYFKLNTDIVPAEELSAIVAKVQNLLAVEEYAAPIQKMQLGRCMLTKLNSEKPELYFWTPNQDKLQFGPVRSTMKSTTDEQLFEINLNYLIDLGNGVEEKTGRLNLENQLNFEEFKIMEIELNKIQKLQDKLNKLNNK